MAPKKILSKLLNNNSLDQVAEIKIWNLGVDLVKSIMTHKKLLTTPCIIRLQQTLVKNSLTLLLENRGWNECNHQVERKTALYWFLDPRKDSGDKL
ncbi:hypothetical protein PPACK8108_LOCUS23821, partial [Phakopsora pachyrhizi]